MFRISAARGVCLAIVACCTFVVFVDALAGSGNVDGDGNLSLNLHFRFPPQQVDIDRVKGQMQRASDLLCDATEGNMRITSVRLSAGGASEPAGDLWYFPPAAMGRPHSTGGPVSAAANRIYLNYESIRSDVLFHEMGHLVFSLGDQYDEQRRFGGACGIGPSFDEGAMDERNHTIMQQSGAQRCVTSGGETSARRCYEDSDCEAGETCPLPALSSEFSVPGNFDTLFGDSLLPADTCPSPRAGDTFEIAGFVGETSAITTWDPTSFDTAEASSVIVRTRDYIDELGEVTAYDEDSAHAVSVYAVRTGSQTWTLHFAIDEKHLDGDPEEGLRELGTVTLEFEATPSKPVTVPAEGSYQHRVLVRVNGVALTDPAYTPPVISLPAFANGAAAAELAVVFQDFEEREGWFGGSFAGTQITAGGAQQLGICADTAACEQRWNTGTERWEATSVRASALAAGTTPLSDWERIVANVESFYDLTWSMPVGAPQEGPSNCGGTVSFEEEVQGTDQVYLVLDRSWSMHEDRDQFGDIRTRLEWAQAGARAFADLLKGGGVEAGIISFASDAVEHLALKPVDDDGAAGDIHELSAFKAVVDGLAPNGDTAMGDALELARVQLASQAEDGRQQAVMLLSDGQNNAGESDPDTVAHALRKDRVLVYTVPLGNDSDGEVLAGIAATTGAETLNAPDPLKLPPLFAQSWGRIRGEAPIWANVRSDTVALNDNFSQTTHIIPVEADSERLNVMLSARNDVAGAWAPNCFLMSPSGVSFQCSDVTVSSIDDFYRLLQVQSPEPGQWLLYVYGLNQPLQRSYVWAHSENAGPDCWAGASPRVAQDTPEPRVELRATASFGAPLGRGVQYFVQVETPNGTLLPVTEMPLGEAQNGGEYLFTDFQGRGRCDVLVTCVAGPAAKYSPGEQADEDVIRAQASPRPFLRQARTSFFLDVADFPPPPGGGDCDDDGIPDTVELSQGGGADSDGDGVQNYCDTDADNDEVPNDEDQCPTLAEEHNGVLDTDGCPERDRDGDGVPDHADNCTAVANADQRDSDGDGYGNRCDADLNNDLATNALDLGLFKRAFDPRSSATPALRAAADLSGDGRVNALDLGLFKRLFNRPPGPSGRLPVRRIVSNRE